MHFHRPWSTPILMAMATSFVFVETRTVTSAESGRTS